MPEAAARRDRRERERRRFVRWPISRRAPAWAAAVVKRLAEADAFGSLQLNRRAALWQALDQTPRVEDLPLFAALEATDSSAPALPLLTPQQEVYADYHAAGLTLRKHPLSFFRAELDELRRHARGRARATGRTARTVKVAGLVLMRQRPGTAKGITFVTLEDETGIANLIIHARTCGSGTSWRPGGRRR